MTLFLNKICIRIASLYSCKETQLQYAWWILEHVTQSSKTELLTGNAILTQEMHDHIDIIIKQHVEEHKPLAYIIGSVPFASCTIITQSPILIPRMETEEWIVALIKTLNSIPAFLTPAFSILDLCSGSGCIAIALAKAFPSAHITAIDIEPQAIELIKKNMEHNNVTNITVMQSDLFEVLEKKPQFDFIVSNPPYITPSEYMNLAPSVYNWEDPKALRAPDEGLAIIKRIINQAPLYLRHNSNLANNDIPQLVLEIGHKQGDSVKTIMKAEKYRNIKIEKDSAQKDRIVMGRSNYVEQKQGK